MRSAAALLLDGVSSTLNQPSPKPDLRQSQLHSQARDHSWHPVCKFRAMSEIGFVAGADGVPSLCLSACRSVGLSVGLSVRLSVGRSVDPSVGRSDGRSVGRSDCQSRSVGCSSRIPSLRSMSHAPSVKMNEAQRYLFSGIWKVRLSLNIFPSLTFPMNLESFVV